MFRRAAAVIVLGRRDLEAISQVLQPGKDQITVVHNAVPDPVPNLDRRTRKGVPDLLKALASPAAKHLRWRATLAGGGPIDEYRNLAKDLGILDSL
jgi:hypothetical protein